MAVVCTPSVLCFVVDTHFTYQLLYGKRLLMTIKTSKLRYFGQMRKNCLQFFMLRKAPHWKTRKRKTQNILEQEPNGMDWADNSTTNMASRGALARETDCSQCSQALDQGWLKTRLSFISRGRAVCPLVCFSVWTHTHRTV